jgi:hypothetical protein
VEKQPTERELETARERARADAEERFAYESSGREPDELPGEQPLPYAAEDVQAEYARVYEQTLYGLRGEGKRDGGKD